MSELQKPPSPPLEIEHQAPLQHAVSVEFTPLMSAESRIFFNELAALGERATPLEKTAARLIATKSLKDRDALKRDSLLDAQLVLRAAMTEKALEQAEIDSLTGLPNRAVFDRDIDRACKRAQPGTALLLMDLDNFKQVNDTPGLGHPVGDQLLSRVGHVLMNQERLGERTYRIGGDEFAVILQNLKPDENGSYDAALEAATKRRVAEVDAMLETVEELAKLDDTARVGISAGGYNLQSSDTPQQAYEQADIAMYADKRVRKSGDR